MAQADVPKTNAGLFPSNALRRFFWMFLMREEIIRDEPSLLAIVSCEIAILYKEYLATSEYCNIGDEFVNRASAFHGLCPSSERESVSDSRKLLKVPAIGLSGCVRAGTIRS